MTELEKKLLEACRAAREWIHDWAYRGEYAVLKQLDKAIEAAERKVKYEQRVLESD